MSRGRGVCAIRRPVKRWVVRLATALAAIVAVVALGAQTATAKIVHEFEGRFSGPERPATLIYNIAAERAGASHYVWVGEQAVFSGEALIEKYEADGKSAGVAITGTPTESFAFSNGLFGPTGGIAVDGSGSLYVADPTHNVVDKFSGTGTYECQITGSATPSTTECDNAGSKTPAEGFEPAGIAVNPAGDLYVTDTAHNVVDEFGPNGEYVREYAGEQITEPRGVAVDGSGDVYVVNGGSVLAGGGTNVVKFDEAGKFLTVVDSNAPLSVAVDTVTGHNYFQDNNEGQPVVDEQDSSGNPLASFGQSAGQGYLAVDAATGQIYVTENSFETFKGSVRIYGGDIVVPTVTVAAAGNVAETSATFHGEVSPDTENGGNEVTMCQFEYVTLAQYEASGYSSASTAECSPSTPYTSATAVTANVTGLAASTPYRYRLKAANQAHPTNVSYSEGPSEESFSTTGPPTVTQTSVSGITRREATLAATINPNGFATEYWFEYGETEAYGNKVPIGGQSIGEGQAAVAVNQTLSKLEVGKTYHYRVVAKNARGTATSADETFATLPVAGVELMSATAGPHAATIKAKIDATEGQPTLGGPTSCALQYVGEAEYASAGFSGVVSSTPCEPQSINAEASGEKVIVHLMGLAANTRYHYRFIVANEEGKAAEGEGTFDTFGLESFAAELSSQEGGPYTQAGGHPYDLTTELILRKSTNSQGYTPGSGRIKDVHVQLPPGLVGNPTSVIECGRYANEHRFCPPGAQVGVLAVSLAEDESGHGSVHVSEVPLFDLVPPQGIAAEFGTPPINGQAVALIDAKVRAGEGYGIEAASLNIATIGNVVGVKVTMWGVPADGSHNAERVCEKAAETQYVRGCGSGIVPKPFLRVPTSCGGSMNATAAIDAYGGGGESIDATSPISAGVTGCAKLQFRPTLHIVPQTSSSDSPTGMQVDLHIPQEESPSGLAEADLKNAEVKLPAGVTVNPAAAGGMVGCSAAQVDLNGPRPAECPAASKVGSVELATPLLDHALKGAIYVAQQGNAGAVQGSNPFGSLLALYIAIDDPQSGVVVKLAGKVSLDQSTGQVTTTFEENPQLPFEDLKLSFFGGPGAALASPRVCGTYQATSLLEPWSHQPAEGEEAGTPDAEGLSSFQITSGQDASACGAPGFSPGFAAGTISNQAGGFGGFDMQLSRKDGEQRLSTVSVRMPRGLAAILAKVPLCAEPQANAGTCSAASKVGHVTATAGVGSRPIVVPQPGNAEDPVFLTGPYRGAPFGLSIVVPAEVGPFNLGTVVVRAKINVDPHTAQVSVESDPMPTILQGVPLDVRSFDVRVDRPEFMFNPTSCEPMSVTGSVDSAEGASAAVSSRFQAAGCSSLTFKPGFSVFSRKRHTRRFGTYLHVKVTSGPGQANIHSVYVELPKILPSRDATLKQACTAAQFAKDPAGCPAGSRVGYATAHTPVLPVPLSGPVIFVSHGGAAFPDLDVVLSGDGVTVDLTGTTNIRHGVTSSDFKSVPDVPISAFELTLPPSAHSALTATGNLCFRSGTKRVKVQRHGRIFYRAVRRRRVLVMPTIITAQNGAQIKQNTIIDVEGCGKPKGKK